MVKTRLQSGAFPYTTVRAAVPTILKEEGVAAFFRGVIPRMLIIGPLFGITFTIFELLQRRLFGEDAETEIELLQEDISSLRTAR